MANRVLLGKLEDSTEFGLLISKPGVDVVTHAITNGETKDLIFDSRKNRNGQVIGGGVDIDFVFSPSASNEASESQGLNYLSATGVKKSQLGFIPLVIHVEKNVGEFEDFAPGDRDIYVSDIGMMESTATLICPVTFEPDNDTNDQTPHTSVISGATPTRGRNYDGLTSAKEDCLNCSYYVLRIPCAYGYMTSTYL